MGEEGMRQPIQMVVKITASFVYELQSGGADQLAPIPDGKQSLIAVRVSVVAVVRHVKKNQARNARLFAESGADAFVREVLKDTLVVRQIESLVAPRELEHIRLADQEMPFPDPIRIARSKA